MYGEVQQRMRTGPSLLVDVVHGCGVVRYHLNTTTLHHGKERPKRFNNRQHLQVIDMEIHFLVRPEAVYPVVSTMSSPSNGAGVYSHLYCQLQWLEGPSNWNVRRISPPL